MQGHPRRDNTLNCRLPCTQERKIAVIYTRQAPSIYDQGSDYSRELVANTFIPSRQWVAEVILRAVLCERVRDRLRNTVHKVLLAIPAASAIQPLIRPLDLREHYKKKSNASVDLQLVKQSFII